jgi:release factor glutamine methyltransferase
VREARDLGMADVGAGATVRSALAGATRALAPVHASARLDAEVLLAHVLGRARAHLYGHPERRLDADEGERLSALVARRARGEPVAYLVGRRVFWSLDLEVSPATLIPRPETELLVAAALARIPPGAAWRVADLGTGSGAVAIALALARPRAEVIATERSAAALAVAARNVERLAPGRVRLVQGDWCEPLGPEPCGLIAANPPYVAEGDPHLDTGDVAFEPREALLAGPDGLAALAAIASAAPGRLGPGGWLLLEHGAEQGAAVRGLLGRGGWRAVRTLKDLEGRERVTEGRRP